MPLTGTRDLSNLVAGSPLVTNLESERWEFPGAQILQLMYEIDDAQMTSLIPPALHPTIPPTLVFTVTRVPESPAGPFLLAEVRVGSRSGARPRGFLARAYCDSATATKELRERWGLPGPDGAGDDGEAVRPHPRARRGGCVDMSRTDVAEPGTHQRKRPHVSRGVERRPHRA